LLKGTEFGEMTQYDDHYAVRSWSPLLPLPVGECILSPVCKILRVITTY